MEPKLTGDQIRWKFSALKKSYNKKRDHNRTSGNAPKALDEFEERIKEIIGDKSGDAIKENSFNSPLLKRTSLNQSQEQNIILLENVDIEKKINDIQNNIKINQMRKHDIPEIDSENINIEETINSGQNNIKINQVKKHTVHETGSENVNVEKKSNSGQNNIKVNQRRKRSVHGTGSKIARTKLELEKQWLEHLKIIQQKYEDRRSHDGNKHKRKIEELELKREKLNLKKEESNVTRNKIQ